MSKEIYCPECKHTFVCKTCDQHGPKYDLDAAVLKSFKKGMTYLQVADIHGQCMTTIWRIVQKYDLDILKDGQVARKTED